MALQPRPRQQRPAFTLVEMLVAMALILFIMVILSEAFVSGLEAFRQLKAIGDMEERLRTTAVELRRDLNADHFEGRRRLSDPNFWLQPVREGFFQITQATNIPTRNGSNGPYYIEGTDDLSNPSYRAVDHRLHFSVKLRGNGQDRFFSAAVPQGSPLRNPAMVTNFFNQPPDGRFQSDPQASDVYNSPWAEVAYFLVPTGGNAGSGVPLYSLYRSQLVVVPDNRQLNWPPTPQTPIKAGQLANYLGFSCQPGTAPTFSPLALYFNCPSDLATGLRTFKTADLLLTDTQLKDPNKLSIYQNMANRSTLLLTDVISFQVQILNGKAPTSGASTAPPDFTNLASLGAGLGGSFDTSDPQHSSQYQVLAIQVTVRVWDVKTDQARQITIIQDM